MPSGDSQTENIVLFGPFRLSGTERLLTKDQKAVAVGDRALDILIALTDRAGKVVDARELTDLVWPGRIIDLGNLRTHIAALRKALGDGQDGSRYIVNIPGRGYSFVAPIRGQSPDRSLAPVGPRPPATAPQALPAPPQRLFGRKETVENLSALLLSQRFVSVVGPGGIGKTTVALAVAHALQNEFEEDLIFFIDLVTVPDPSIVAGTVAAAVGCSAPVPNPAPNIAAFLSDKRALLLLDNCEHVIEEVASLAERLFHELPSIHILTTSREALRVEGENVHLLAPLSGPSDDAPSAAQALSSPAVQLFMERAAASGHTGELGDADAPIVTDICSRLDGIALAIQLAASRVGTYGLRGTADLLDNGGGLLLRGSRNAQPRHQTLHAAHEWSFRLLTPIEQTVLCRLSIFVGDFTHDAALAVAADSVTDRQSVINAITSLVEKSLVRISTSGGSPYFKLLDTTRSYACARLRQSGEADETSRRHALYFTEFLRARETQELQSHGRNVAAYAPHLGNVRQALAWCFSAAGAPSLGIALAAHAAPLLLTAFSLLAECRGWCRRALEALTDDDRGSQRELELQKALALSSMYVSDNSDEVKAAIERGLELSHSLMDWATQQYLLVGLNVFLTRCGDINGALAVAKKAVETAARTGSAADKVIAEWMLGDSYHVSGDQAAAIRHCEAAHKAASVIAPAQLTFFGYDYGIRGLSSFGRSLWLSGFRDQGDAIARDVIRRADTLTHPALYSTVLFDSIRVLQWGGSLVEAAEHTERVIARAERYSISFHHTVGRAVKGELMIAGGDPAGLAVLQEALKYMDDRNYRVVMLPSMRALAEGFVLCGRPAEALEAIDAAIVRAEQLSGTFRMPDLLRAKGEILLAQTRPDSAAAEAALRRAIDVARAQSALSWELNAAISLARMWISQGKSPDAHAMIAEIYPRFTEGFDTRELRIARELLHGHDISI